MTTAHDHVFLAPSHAARERRTWAVIGLCSAMMIAEIAGGWAFGSIALIADGLHMSTHAGALLLAALAYTYARRHAHDPRFAFGTGKFGDLAGFASAIILAMIALLVGYEAVTRLFNPVAINFNQAIPIAAVGLAVNLASAWLLGAGHHQDGHGHDDHGHHHDHDHEHGHSKSHRDNNMRAAIVHVIADAAVSVLVIIGLVLARTYGLLWMDPAAGIIGAVVIASWAYGLIGDTGAILLDMTADHGLAAKLRAIIAEQGDELSDLHLWRVGPGHLSAILEIRVQGGLGTSRTAAFYRARLAELPMLSHVTIEIVHPAG